MPDCTELQRAVDASIAIIDGLVSQLDGELMLLLDFEALTVTNGGAVSFAFVGGGATFNYTSTTRIGLWLLTSA